MKRNIVYVTGANGFMGSNVSEYFTQKGWEVYPIDKSGLAFKSLVKLTKMPELIVHCAGSASVAYSFSNPMEDFEANVSSLLTVLEFMRLKCPAARLIYPSSVAVYGTHKDSPIKEEDLLNPVSPYGFHKKIAEELCKSYSDNFSLKISVIRFFSLYGRGLRKQLLWDACQKIKNAQNKVEFFGTGKETRDWTHIKDALNLIYKLGESKNKFEILNGASGKRVEIKYILKELVGQYGKNVKVFFNGKIRKGDPRYYHADISKAAATGWKPTVNLKAGLKDYVKFYKTCV